MNKHVISAGCALCLGVIACSRLCAQESPPLNVQSLPGVSLISTTTASMTEEQLVTYFEQLQRGAPVELTLDKGKTVKGIFSSYDDYYGMVWLVPQGNAGLLSQKGFRISGIKSVRSWNKNDPASLEQMGSNDYRLLKEMDNK